MIISTALRQHRLAQHQTGSHILQSYDPLILGIYVGILCRVISYRHLPLYQMTRSCNNRIRAFLSTPSTCTLEAKHLTTFLRGVLPLARCWHASYGSLILTILNGSLAINKPTTKTFNWITHDAFLQFCGSVKVFSMKILHIISPKN